MRRGQQRQAPEQAGKSARHPQQARRIAGGGTSERTGSPRTAWVAPRSSRPPLHQPADFRAKPVEEALLAELFGMATDGRRIPGDGFRACHRIRQRLGRLLAEEHAGLARPPPFRAVRPFQKPARACRRPAPPAARSRNPPRPETPGTGSGDRVRGSPRRARGREIPRSARRSSAAHPFPCPRPAIFSGKPVRE